VEVQFNPATLKVNLANTLGQPPRGGSSRAAQYVDKSSSTLSVELIFDTTYIDRSAEDAYRDRAALAGRKLARIEAGSDVRLLTRRIAERFLKPVAEGQRMKAPSRCLFQWGAFEFLGLVQSVDETLDFFSPEGIPLRSTVALKLSEDRYQFRSIPKTPAERANPQLSATSATNQPVPDPSKNNQPVPGASKGPGNWRDIALYNGIESPRLPTEPQLAVPRAEALSVRLSGSLAGGLSASVSPMPTAPGFAFGASGRLGTGIAGAFPGSAGGQAASGSAIASASASASATGAATARASARAGVGFD
jgi:hypothetical protein